MGRKRAKPAALEIMSVLEACETERGLWADEIRTEVNANRQKKGIHETIGAATVLTTLGRLRHEKWVEAEADYAIPDDPESSKKREYWKLNDAGEEKLKALRDVVDTDEFAPLLNSAVLPRIRQALSL